MSITLDTDALSEVERVKAESRGLRGTLGADLEDGAPDLGGSSRTLLKYHGSYQQDDRDERRARKRAGEVPAWSFMIRSKVPGGVLTPEQYRAHDDLAVRFGGGSLRVTTRQALQLHGVVKGSLRPTIAALNEALVTTYGSCGDVVRNVVTCPAPLPGTAREEVIRWARVLSDETLPRSRAYHEIWVEGTRVTTDAPAEPDPLYGERYLPRKFKVAFGFPEDNCTDVRSNDLGFLAIAPGGRLRGFNVLVGGGLGQTHGRAETFPRLAEPLGFVAPESLVEVTRAVVAVQREHGNRENRRRSRLRYLLDERGVDWFRERVEEVLGRRLPPARPAEIHGVDDHLGWHAQADGRWFRGVWIENGRIRDGGALRLRSALRAVVDRFGTAVHLTPQQNLLLVGIAGEDRAGVDALLEAHGVPDPGSLSGVRRSAMACPALPTCPLAVAESERVFPAVLARLDAVLEELGLGGEPIAVRMTGCPNGCARPYTAELAFVGRSAGRYVVHVGGSAEGTRLASPWADLVPQDDLVGTVRPLLERFRDERREGERFGDFWARIGVEPLARAGGGR
jgi:sulfite reductase (ferredoxin)